MIFMMKTGRKLTAAGILIGATALSLGGMAPANAAAHPVGDFPTKEECEEVGLERYGDPDWGSGTWWHCWQIDQDGETWDLFADDPFLD
jgi:uncharacterized membrane protein